MYTHVSCMNVAIIDSQMTWNFSSLLERTVVFVFDPDLSVSRFSKIPLMLSALASFEISRTSILLWADFISGSRKLSLSVRPAWTRLISDIGEFDIADDEATDDAEGEAGGVAAEENLLGAGLPGRERLFLLPRSR